MDPIRAKRQDQEQLIGAGEELKKPIIYSNIFKRYRQSGICKALVWKNKDAI